MTVVWVALGAVVGAPLRYLVDRSIRRYRDTAFPYGTFAVNLTASLILGAVIGAGMHASGVVIALVGTGFCGALSTYSTFGYENQQLVVRRARTVTVTYVTVSVLGGLGVAALGWQLARLWW